MKRYWLFNFNNCYPLGGMKDFYKDYDSVADCHKGFEDNPKCWYQIFDSIERVVLFDSDKPEKYEVHGGKIDACGDEWEKIDVRLKKLYPIELWD